MTERVKTNGVEQSRVEWNGMKEMDLRVCYNVHFCIIILCLFHPLLKWAIKWITHLTTTHIQHTHMHAPIHSFVRSSIHWAIRFVQAEARLKTNTNFSFRKKYIILYGLRRSVRLFDSKWFSVQLKRKTMFFLYWLQFNPIVQNFRFSFTLFYDYILIFGTKLRKEFMCQRIHTHTRALHIILSWSDDGKQGIKTSVSYWFWNASTYIYYFTVNIQLNASHKSMGDKNRK